MPQSIFLAAVFVASRNALSTADATKTAATEPHQKKIRLPNLNLGLVVKLQVQGQRCGTNSLLNTNVYRIMQLVD